MNRAITEEQVSDDSAPPPKLEGNWLVIYDAETEENAAVLYVTEGSGTFSIASRVGGKIEIDQEGVLELVKEVFNREPE